MTLVRATVIAPDGSKRVLGEVPLAVGRPLGQHFALHVIDHGVGGIAARVPSEFVGEVWCRRGGPPNPAASERAGVALVGPVVFVELVEQPEAVARG